MIIQLHSKTGIETIDTDKLTIQRLKDKGLDHIVKAREAKTERDAKIDACKTLEELKTFLKEATK